MKTKKILFEIYRYQILPKKRDFHYQPDLFENIKSLEQLLDSKNHFFIDALDHIRNFSTPKTTITHEIIFKKGDFILFRFGPKRQLTRETENFTTDKVETWPSFFVLVWNDPKQQLIAIQQRREAFQTTEIVANSIIDHVNNIIGKYNLRAHVEALFVENEFWDLVKQNKGKIKEIRFELITPNLANISNVLNDELIEFAKGTNTAKTSIDIESDPDASILIEPTDNRIKQLVAYASQGCGNISLKIRGLSKLYHTKKRKRHIEIDSIEINNAKNPQEIASIIEKLIK